MTHTKDTDPQQAARRKDTWLNAYADACLKYELLDRAARVLAFHARTSGGVAGRDEGLCAALDAIEKVFQAALTAQQAARREDDAIIEDNRLRLLVQQLAWYYSVNDCAERHEDDALEVSILDLKVAHEIAQELGLPDGPAAVTIRALSTVPADKRQ